MERSKQLVQLQLESPCYDSASQGASESAQSPVSPFPNTMKELKMTSSRPQTRMEFTAMNREHMEQQINTAVDTLRVHAMNHREGILVTRHTYDSFTVELCRSVPAGLTRESWSW